MDPNLAKTISQLCLNGRPLPSGLEKLWAAREHGDRFLSDHLGIELFTSLDLLDAGYNAEIAQGNGEVLANVRAHRRVFSRVGFFAGTHESQLAFDFESHPIVPPVVRLDSEGQYEWQGIDLVEAIFRTGADLGLQETSEWLTSVGLPIGTVDEIGASTQFLPSIGDLQERYYYEEIGTPMAVQPSGLRPAEPHDPTSWIMRPGNEVQGALVKLLRLPPHAKVSRQWVQCDSDGRVCTLWFHPTAETKNVVVGGATFGMSPSEAVRTLGTPARTGDGWISFSIAAGRLRVGFDADKLNEICLMAE
ncbi:MAG TPA: hypothetical protein VK797_20865 [Tepidisphaeraceae bacterium]|nr:hypothetical protein [Tepidisphaeraceae bacterium]